ncbi:MAG: hypothetical protein EHM58_02120 [Ignavibacteriae bacterium]|nr:MAG: hypothetical protein EHM58_02120 [Ignavibacteriota bacterium]
MKKSDITELLSCLSKDEFKKLGDFIKSPFFSIPNRIHKLYDIFYSKYTQDKTPEVSREEIAELIYQDEEKRTDSNIKKLISDFVRTFELFLIHLEFERQNEEEHQLLLLKHLRKKCLTDKYDIKFQDLKKHYLKNTKRDEEYYKFGLDLIDEELSYKFSKNILENPELEQEKSLRIDLNFLYSKLHIFQAMFSRQYFLGNAPKYEWEFLNEINAFVKENIVFLKESHYTIYINYLLLNLLLSPDQKEYFDETKQYLLENEKLIQTDDKVAFFDQLINFCMLKVNNGEIEFEKDIIELVKKEDELDIIKRANELDFVTFKIVIESCIGQKEFDWLEYFIVKYGKLINPEYRDNIINISYAKLYLYKKDYQKAHQYQENISYIDYFHYIDAKLILARIGYETGDIEELLNAADTVRKYLKSHKEIPANYYEGYLMFINSLLKLLKLQEDSMEYESDDMNINYFIDELKVQKKFIYAGNWLIEKAEELLKQKSRV